MVQPAISPKDSNARSRAVTPETIAAAYQSLYPAEVSDLTAHIAAAQAWIAQIESDPAGAVGHNGTSRKVIKAFFKALDLPAPKTNEMALFVLTHPDMVSQPTELVYVRASTPGGDNVDLVVRAISRQHAEVAWRDHFEGWDLPERPYSVTVLPQAGPLGAIPWSAFAPDADVEDRAEEMQPPAL